MSTEDLPVDLSEIESLFQPFDYSRFFPDIALPNIDGNSLYPSYDGLINFGDMSTSEFDFAGLPPQAPYPTEWPPHIPRQSRFGMPSQPVLASSSDGRATEMSSPTEAYSGPISWTSSPAMLPQSMVPSSTGVRATEMSSQPQVYSAPISWSSSPPMLPQPAVSPGSKRRVSEMSSLPTDDGHPNGTVPIPKKARTGSVQEPSGPLSAPVKLPEKKKPGRKPISEENPSPNDTPRKGQNRNAQRKHRDQRLEKMKQALIDLNEANATITNLRGEHLTEVDRLMRQIRYLKRREGILLDAVAQPGVHQDAELGHDAKMDEEIGKQLSFSARTEFQ